MELKVNDPKLIEAIFNGDAPDIYFAPDVDTLISEKDALIAELKSEADKVIAKKDAEIAELKKKLMPCLNGDCILTCEVVEKYGKENAELKAKLESVQASMYADVVDANMENRRLKRALWLARANRADGEFIYWCARFAVESGFTKADIRGYSVNTKRKLRTIGEWIEVWKNVRTKFLKKEEEYK